MKIQRVSNFISQQKKLLLRVIILLSTLGAVSFLGYLMLHLGLPAIYKLALVTGFFIAIAVLLLSLQSLLSRDFRLDKIFVLGISAFVFLFFYLIGSGPVTYDDLLYIHSGMNLTADPTILWRYTHVYLIKLALWILHGNPFLAEKTIWALYIALSVPVIYFGSKHLVKAEDKTASIFAGFSSVLLFFCLPFLENAGLAYPDIAVMFYIGLGVWIFIEYLRNPKFENWLLPLFGFILWIGFNAKEMAFVLVVLIPGILLASNISNDRWTIAIKRALKIGGGALFGIILFIALDAIFLKQPLFHWQLENWKLWLSFNENQNDFWSKWNYLSYFTSTSLLSVFLLAFFNLIKLRKSGRIDLPASLIWMILPIVLIINTFIQFQVFNRYTIPMYLPLAIIAGQGWLLIDDLKKKRAQILALTLLIIAVSYFGYTKFLLPFLINKTGQLEGAISGVYIPVIFLVFMILILWVNRPALLRSYLVIAFISMSLVPSLYINIDAWQNQTSSGRSSKHYAAIIPFVKELSIRNNSTILISPALNDNYGMFYPMVKPTTWMINVYFRTNLPTDQITLNIPDNQNIISGNFDYIFMSNDDWSKLANDPSGEILNLYSVNTSKKVVLLVKK